MFVVERRPHSIINRRTAHRRKLPGVNSSASCSLRGLHCPFVLRDGAKEAIDYFKRRIRMKIDRRGSAVWQGGIKDGKGAISTQSGALNAYPYGFASRFEGVPGTNPEELLAAAHAGCFTMALSLILGEAKLTAEQMETSANVTLEQIEGGYAITAVHLTLKAKVPGADQATFEELANKAKAGCPVSKLFKAEITLDATLLS
jgi:osmotically inducible protein OsmC